jgi:Ca2+-binding EF-hand superfamily protein
MGALINERDIKLLVKKYDVEKTGKIAFDEYLLMMSEVVDKSDSTE